MEVALVARRFLAMLVIAGSAALVAPALAQEDLNRGKTAAQLYASDCVDCHKNPRALGGRNNAGNLAGFLRVHYTASRESAAAIANYLVSLGADARPAAARPAGTAARPRPAAGQEQGKSEQGKSEPGKTAPAAEAAKPAEAAAPKPAEAAPEKPAPAPAEPAPAAPSSPPAAPASPPANPQ